MLHRAPLLLAILALCNSSFGQNPYVDDVYGDGVHAYFRGEIYLAQEQFDRAIEYGSRDPRVFYFRAILHLQNGDCFQAEQDIRTAVTYELQGRGTYDVGRSLQRIQGPLRRQLEHMRLLAKLDYSASQQALSDQPGATMPPQRVFPQRVPMIPESPFELDDERAPADASDLDLDQPRTPSDAATPESELPEITEAPADKPDPFADDQFQPEAQPAEQPGAPDQAPDQLPADEDPFGTDDPFATGDDDSPF